MNLKDPVLQTYLIAASLMCLKTMLQAWITVHRMIKVNGGFLFTLTQPALWVAQILLYGCVTSRLLHAYALGAARTHDLRAVFFTMGSFIVIGMSLYTLVIALRG